MNEIRRLRLAEADMAQAAIAAMTLEREHLNGDLCRALETAIAVCYARPFGGRNKVGMLGDEWKPEDPKSRALHDSLLTLRDQVYAHSDRTDARGIVDAGALFGMPGSYAEQWRPLNREILPAIIGLAEEQQARFRARAKECQDQLRAADADK